VVAQFESGHVRQGVPVGAEEIPEPFETGLQRGFVSGQQFARFLTAEIIQYGHDILLGRLVRNCGLLYNSFKPLLDLAMLENRHFQNRLKVSSPIPRAPHSTQS
jgi:hypothetical protein